MRVPVTPITAAGRLGWLIRDQFWMPAFVLAIRLAIAGIRNPRKDHWIMDGTIFPSVAVLWVFDERWCAAARSACLQARRGMTKIQQL
jgi:hypothetical protein